MVSAQCFYCGNDYEISLSALRRGQRFCSSYCATEWYRENGLNWRTQLAAHNVAMSLIDPSYQPKGPSEETRKKLSEANRGKKHTEETKKKISEGVRKIMTPEMRKKISEVTRERMSQEAHHMSQEARQKISESRLGKKISEETRKRMCAAQQKRRSTENVESRRGHHLSEETKRKISEAMRGRGFGVSMPIETRRKISETKRGRPAHNKGKKRKK